MAAQPATQTSSSTKTTVMIKDYAFSPASLKVAVGDTVTWTNMDTAPHTVTVTGGPVKFDSGTLQKGESFTYTFTKAGDYQYYCAVHPDMKGSVTVTATGGSSATPTPAPTDPKPADPAPMDPMPSSGSCEGLQATVDAFIKHVNAAHLGESPTQQVADALSIDQYVKTHTVLVESMVKPLLGGADTTMNAFMKHVYAAHLGESPTQQVADALSVDQYVKTHTVLVESMVKPFAGTDLSSC